MENPFSLEPYTTKERFCDREQELMDIVSLLTNGSNVTLISPRRYGKTGLIFRTFDTLQENNYTCIYADIFSAQCLEDFIKILSEAIISSMASDSLIKKFFIALKNVRPLLSYDPISGAPQVSLSFQTDSQKTPTLKTIFDFLEKQGKQIIFAIDEFQQIREFKETNIEALLRTYIQQLHYVKFIFCGSKKHLMADMFTNAKKPFYESTRTVYIDRIDLEKYKAFITSLFKKAGKNIDDDAVDFILDWTKRHTYYTQFVCNQVFAESSNKISLENVKNVASSIIRLEITNFIERRNLLTEKQWQFLIAVAKEGSVRQPTASAFLMKYRIGSSATAKKILTTLVEKELLLEQSDLNGKNYSVYNVFMSRWMESL
ncbi:ATP-binding protein [uncultured Fibrobacter sp.]|uniref:AAA family ATPase n=1 Tax=uncultured Fibrobacter sp. TaxID=261512 RepID=UPI0026004A58|nr:ATP-binding protein [uncultured Fibrobacter sp.]